MPLISCRKGAHVNSGVRESGLRSVAWVREERDAKLANEFGFSASFLEQVPFVNRRKFANQAKFHPRKYLAGLPKAIEVRARA